MTIPLMMVKGPCPSIDEIILPDADIITFPDPAGWMLGPDDAGAGWEQLNDTDDTDTIQSFVLDDFPPGIEKCSVGKTTFTHKIGLANPVGQPGPSLCQGLKWTVRRRKAPDLNAGTVDLLYELRQGSTLKDTNHNDEDIGTSYVTDVITLTDAEYDAITDHNNLQLWLIAEVCVDTEFEELAAEVAWVQGEYFTKP